MIVAAREVVPIRETAVAVLLALTLGIAVPDPDLIPGIVVPDPDPTPGIAVPHLGLLPGIAPPRMTAATTDATMLRRNKEGGFVAEVLNTFLFSV